MGIKVDNVVRSEIFYGAELTEAEREEFDYYTGDDLDSAMFVRDHTGAVYDLGEFVDIPEDVAGFEEWDVYMGEGFFMGKVVRYLPGDGDLVEIGGYVA